MEQQATVIYDPRMTICPKCVDSDAIVKLHTVPKVGGFCKYHGQITSFSTKTIPK